MMIRICDHHNNFIEKMFETFFFMWIHQKGVHYTCLKIAPYQDHLKIQISFPLEHSFNFIVLQTSSPKI